ncbi:MAG TPA: M28 family peptidase [Chitinophagaceae bacterium]
MLYKSIIASALILSFTEPGFAQKLKKEDKAIISGLEEHIHFLADDKLEGRRAGSNGEKLAMEYIAGQFEKAGLSPRGDNNGWYQAFDINEGKEFVKTSYLFINNAALKPGDYFPFTGSPATAVEGAPAIALREAGVPWFLNLKEEVDNNHRNPHFDIMAYITRQVAEAAKMKATALIIYNTGAIADGLKFDGGENSPAFAIPVFYVQTPVARKYFGDEAATVDIRLKAAFTEKKRTGHNVAGYIDNGAQGIVVLGAHFDHLGYGEDSNSLYRGPERKIHPGADDNASGVAALIELSHLLKTGKLKNNNYLFLAFSGEELGLFGSKYFTEHPTVDLSRVNYMINMDMVGRLNDSTKMLTIGGYGTSPVWGPLFTSISRNQYFINRYDSSGTGPSDHTSFYRKNIPVLFFFTGMHSDYHKPTDSADKINYTGEWRVIRYIYKITEAANGDGKLVFTPTRETNMSVAHFSVTLGILPDYSYSGAGVRVDGVSDGRPAFKAGLKAGDVVIQLGEYPVPSMESYMQALNRFKKGDKTTVKVKRGENTIEANIEF